MNVEVFAHLEAGEGEAVATALDGNTVEGGGVRSTFSAVFTDATVPGAESVYASAVLPLLQAYVAGYDVCLVVAGESGTAKLTALLGDPSDDSRPGLVKLAVDQLLGGSDSSYGTHGKLMVGEADYAASFWEINNEVVTDLNNPEGAEPTIAIDPERGEHLVGTTSINITSIEHCLKVFRTGVSRMTSGTTKLGPSENRSSTCFSLRRTATKGPPTWSTFSFVHLAGAEALAEDAAHVEMVGGPNLNRGIATFARVASTLAGDPAAVVSAPYGSSKLTTLLRSALGGNCKTHVLTPIRLANKGGTTEVTAEVLRLCSDLRRVVTHPVLGSQALRGLEARYRRIVEAAATGSLGPTSASASDASNVNVLKLEAENQRLHEKLAEMGRRYSEALEDKARAAAASLSTEEKRLEVTKALLDVRIETARVQEEAEAASFDQVNRILELEREVAELHDLADATDTKGKVAAAKADELAEEAADLRDEMVALRKSHLKTREELDVEKARTDELGLELLKAAKTNSALERELDDALGNRGSSAPMRVAQPAQAAVAEGAGRVIAVANAEDPDTHTALAAKLQDAAALRSDITRLEQQLLTRDERARRWTLGEEGIVDSRIQQLAGKLLRLQEELKTSRSTERAAVRDANSARATAREVAIQNDALTAENDDLKGKQMERMNLYRERLAKYVKDIGDFVATSGGDYFPGMETQLKRYVDLMLKDLTDSYAHREQQLCASIERRLQREDALIQERARLKQAFDATAAQLEAAGLEATANPYPADPAAAAPTDGSDPKTASARAPLALSPAGMPTEFFPTTAQPTQASFQDVKKAMSQFTQATQRKLEQERAGLLIRCSAAEEKVKQMENYIATKLSAYQEEIVRLRRHAR